MKSFKNIVLCALSLFSATAAFAENKQQIRLSNQYGQDVDVSIEWRKKNWPHTHGYTNLYLKSSRKNFSLKAPSSGRELFKIYVTPALNRLSYVAPALAVSSGTATAVGLTATAATATTAAAAAAPLIIGYGAGALAGRISYGIASALNHSAARAHGNRHFIIKAEKHNSKVLGQKEIKIHGMSEAEYNKEIGKAEVVEVEITPSEIYESTEENVTSSENYNIDDESQAQANLDKLINAMR